MPSRQDQLHSYQFAVARTVAALVTRDSDPALSPTRRLAGAALASILVAAVGLGATGSPDGGGTWRRRGRGDRREGVGARFVYRDQRLHPVLNYASALLIIGAQRPKTVLVSRRSIDGVPRGLPLGIRDAPDSLPPAGRLATAGWTVCSVSPAGDGPGPPRSVLTGGCRRHRRPTAGPGRTAAACGGRPAAPALAAASTPDPGHRTGAGRARDHPLPVRPGGRRPAQLGARRSRSDSAEPAGPGPAVRPGDRGPDR